MKLSTILGLVQAIGLEVLNAVPGAKVIQWAVLAASAAQKAVDVVQAEGTEVVDDAGNPVPADVLVARIQDTLDRAWFAADQIEQAGKDEINRSRAERGLPPLT